MSVTNAGYTFGQPKRTTMTITFETEITLEVKAEHVEKHSGSYMNPPDYETRIVSVSCPDIPSLTEDEIYKLIPYDQIIENL